MNRIIYNQDNGVVAVIIPTPEALEQHGIQAIASRTYPLASHLRSWTLLTSHRIALIVMLGRLTRQTLPMAWAACPANLRCNHDHQNRPRQGTSQGQR